MITLKLYTTSGCHLCEQATEIILAVNKANPELGSIILLELVEIAHSDSLIENFGTRIPVLEAITVNRGEKNVERTGMLNWPFDHEDYVNLLNRAIQGFNDVY